MEFFVFISTAIVTSILLYLIGTNSSEGMEKSPEELAKEEEANRALWLYENDREAWEREFPPQPKDDITVEELRLERANNIKCPYCGSTHYTVMKRGWKVTTGFLGSSKVIRVCDNCLKKF